MTDDELYAAWAALRPQYRIGTLKVARLLHDEVHAELESEGSLFDSDLGMAVAQSVMAALRLYDDFLNDEADRREDQPAEGLAN
jgi:hypothetical protein